MSTDRTTGMTAIGVLNIVLGCIFSFVGLLAVIGGGLLAVVGGTAAGDGSVEAEQAGTLVAAGGGIFALVGIVLLVFNVGLIIAGVGVLKLATWGRTLSMICGGVIALLQMVNIVTSGFGVVSLGLFVYGMCLVGLFMQPAWRETFSGRSSFAQPATTSSEDRFRRAA